MSSRVQGLGAPIDAVYTALHDAKGLTDYARQGMRLGFSGFLLIHPAQVIPAQKALKPTSSQISWAKHVLAAEEREKGAVVAVSGNMVDLPVMARAKRIMELIERWNTAASAELATKKKYRAEPKARRFFG